MSTKKFLDLSGLSRVWGKIGDKFALKSLYSDTSINLGRKSNTTTGTNSVATGYTATASGNYSVALGYNPTASGSNAFAAGRNPTASGDYSCCVGQNCTSSGGSSMAQGMLTTSGGSASHTEGFYTQSQRAYQHVEGACNVVDTNGSTVNDKGKYIHIAGNGTNNNNRSNAYTLDWNGNGCFAGDVYVGATDKDDANAKKLATEEYVDSLVADGAKKTILYNGKANDTAIMSNNTQELSDSIFNYDLIVVGFNCLVQNASRSMEICDVVYPNSSLITWCDATGAGATGAHHIYNGNQGHNNLYRIMWGFTDATHIRNIVASVVNSGSYPWVDAGICYVIGYKFSALPDGYATEQYVDNAIASAVTSAIGGSY